ncbi:hypothetical protein X798_06452, partial [Onchocerca flexuosa]
TLIQLTIQIIIIVDLTFQNTKEEGVNSSERILQPCLPHSMPKYGMKLSINDKTDSAYVSRSNDNDNQNYIEIRSCHADERLNWTMLEQADRLNGKWTVAVALFITIISNIMLPLLAAKHFIFAIFARILCGIADAFLTPSISSMIVRWFPPKERSFAIGFITGGRQIVTIESIAFFRIFSISGSIFCIRMSDLSIVLFYSMNPIN